jgi:hypothetical protein
MIKQVGFTPLLCQAPCPCPVQATSPQQAGEYHHHHQITTLSHSINAIGPAPLNM